VTDPGREELISAPEVRPSPLSFRVKTCPCRAPRGSNTFSTGAAPSQGESPMAKGKNQVQSHQGTRINANDLDVVNDLSSLRCLQSLSWNPKSKLLMNSEDREIDLSA